MTKIHLSASWHCIRDCDAHGDGDDSHREADKHLKASGHAVAVRGTP